MAPTRCAHSFIPICTHLGLPPPHPHSNTTTTMTSIRTSRRRRTAHSSRIHDRTPSATETLLWYIRLNYVVYSRATQNSFPPSTPSRLSVTRSRARTHSTVVGWSAPLCETRRCAGVVAVQVQVVRLGSASDAQWSHNRNGSGST